MKHAIACETIVTHMYTNGAPKLDIVPLHDWVRACWAVLLQGHSGVFHCGTGELYKHSEIVKIIAETVGSTSRIQCLELNEGVANVALDATKLKQDTGWSPMTNIVDGIRAYVRRPVGAL